MQAKGLVQEATTGTADREAQQAKDEARRSGRNDSGRGAMATLSRGDKDSAIGPRSEAQAARAWPDMQTAHHEQLGYGALGGGSVRACRQAHHESARLGCLGRRQGLAGPRHHSGKLQARVAICGGAAAPRHHAGKRETRPASRSTT